MSIIRRVGELSREGFKDFLYFVYSCGVADVFDGDSSRSAEDIKNSLCYSVAEYLGLDLFDGEE